MATNPNLNKFIALLGKGGIPFEISAYDLEFVGSTIQVFLPTEDEAIMDATSTPDHDCGIEILNWKTDEVRDSLTAEQAFEIFLTAYVNDMKEKYNEARTAEH